MRASVLWLCFAACGAPFGTSVELRVPVAPTPLAIDGAPYLVYELHVTNVAREPIELARVRVVDDTGSTAVDLRDAALAERVGGGTTLAPAAHAVVYLEIAFALRMPHRLRHRVEYRRAGETASTGAGGAIEVRTEEPPALGAPLRGGPWVAVHHPAWPRGHRRVQYTVDGRERIPGRYAIDWVKLDDAGRYSRGDEDEVRTWYGYGAEVLAVADGAVVAARDGVPEAATRSAHVQPPAEAAAGNYIAIDLGHSRYVFYEHLQPGSVRVKPGDRVRRGDVIGALGFTGQSTVPHLHMHVADASSLLGAEGAPFVLDFELLGAYPDVNRLGHERWQPRAPSQRRGERPAPNSVVVFP